MAETALQNYVPELQVRYRDQVVPALQEQFKFDNPMQIPRVVKVVLNMGVGAGARDAKILDRAVEDMTLIAGQKANRTRARVSVANFKLREGMNVGCTVTLRGARMWEFLERLISIAIPRIRDFRGLPPKAFDGRGNYNFGIRDHSIFLELDTSKEMMLFGMNITVVTTARTDEECRALLTGIGLPLREL